MRKNGKILIEQWIYFLKCIDLMSFLVKEMVKERSISDERGLGLGGVINGMPNGLN